MEKVKIGVIGGSGIYDIEGITETRKQKISTPFGDPSDTIVIGNLEGIPVAFLPRHGRGHFIMPSELNSRANIYALKSLGVEQIVSISACGSLKEELKPRDIVIPDQLFDRTRQRPYTFFGEGIVAHIGFANPYCPELSQTLYQAAKDLRLSVHLSGTYVCIEGPQFSTKAESKVFRSLGFSIIGMTNLPEAKLAREAEICYATLGLVTDYDVWKEGEEVSVERVVGNLLANIENVKKLIKAAIPRLERERKCECASALAYAIQTHKWAINRRTAKKLDLLVGKYLKK
ncbi:MAG: S-methyl-5'-thioadenosine phosphorylase [Elusimicrobia bacterium]|nr:MAG: S-methyl-5'-thioadenosine phosphorylase [Elusimicrobiota bacterium]